MDIFQIIALAVGLFLFGFLFPWERYPLVKLAFWCIVGGTFVARLLIK